ncbi:hypothetical protein B0H65DRAFT_80893 [Neurospora tetraspora]|uniref:Uncharacterized protein n=1 Tax=Neurospora tetraspora TaxID=94610 RepID=A0AAE0J015_9PEZI|nr:hypothetical protein B0H65DRAFT_80893 [Neurospora tetraspora]
MDGLRNLRAVAEDGMSGRRWFEFRSRFRPLADYSRHRTPKGEIIQVPIVPCAVAQIWPNPRGPAAEYRFSPEIQALLLAEFVKRGYSLKGLVPNGSEPSQYTHTGAKIAFVHVKEKLMSDVGSQVVEIRYESFKTLWMALDPHPRLGKMVSYGMLRGFDFLGLTADNEGVSGYLATRSIKFMWSIRQHDQSPEFDTRCILLSDLSAFIYELDSPSKRVLRGKSFLEEKVHLPDYISSHSPVTDAVNHLKAFKEDSHSPLYLPFAISVYALEECRERIGLVNGRVMTWLSRDESGDHAQGTSKQKLERHEVNRRFMVEFTQQDIPMELETAKMALNTIESLWRNLVIMAKELPDTAKSENVCRSNESILTALYQLQQELEGMRELLTFIEMRINSYLSMRAHYLNQMDAIRNIETAKTTHELAQAARQDSAAMKTIAILTMAFLPATFLSTLLSMPSLN